MDSQGGVPDAATMGENAMHKAIWTGAAILGLAALGGTWAVSAAAQDKDHAPQPAKACFYARDISSWTAVDRSTVNLRVSVDDIYQLKLLGDCPNLDWVNGIGLEHRGSSWICSGLDAVLLVRQPGEGLPIRCPVTSIRRLSREEAKALPPKQHP